MIKNQAHYEDTQDTLTAHWGPLYTKLVSVVAGIKDRSGKLTNYGEGVQDSAAYALVVNNGFEYAEAKAQVGQDVKELVKARRGGSEEKSEAACAYCHHPLTQHTDNSCETPFGKFGCSCPYKGGRN